MTNGKKHGGVRPGSGPKPLSPTGERMKMRTVRMTDAEWQKVLKLGGSAWIRDRIKRARLSEDAQSNEEEEDDDASLLGTTAKNRQSA